MLLEHYAFVDLTQKIIPAVPTWNGSCGFCLEIKKDYDKVFRVQQIKMHAGIGTHMDAPSHRYKQGISIADIPIERLVIPACVINVTAKAIADYVISIEDIQEYEKQYGNIPQHSLVIGYTGWDRFWNDPAKYRNEDANGQMHFPAFAEETAAYLVQRNIAGLAIDTLSPDCLDYNFPVHQHLLGSGKYIIENIANCSKLPPRGAFVIALPLNIENATEAPMRILGLIPRLKDC